MKFTGYTLGRERINASHMAKLDEIHTALCNLSGAIFHIKVNWKRRKKWLHCWKNTTLKRLKKEQKNNRKIHFIPFSAGLLQFCNDRQLNEQLISGFTSTF